MKSVLLVEDDFQLGEVVKAYLEVNQYEVVHHETAEAALAEVKNRAFDCIVLDLNLPDEDGLVVLRKVKSQFETPVIICSARVSSDDRIIGLEFGADDYLIKPFSSKELLLRINNLIDRIKVEKREKQTQLADYQLDQEKKGLLNTTNDSFISLTLTEFYILSKLAGHPGKVYSRGEMIDSISGIEGPENDRAIDVAISRLRKKIEKNAKSPEIIKTAVGFGYYIEPEVCSQR
ncbi:MAG: response regulator [Alteromonadaceae bacterium]|nr:response regulator [Alteromonadaceae bacterium]